MMELSANLTDQPHNDSPVEKTPSLKWEKCTVEQKDAYTLCLDKRLANSPSLLTGCCTSHCKDEACISSIQKEFDNLTQQMVQADRVLPRHKPGIQKSWWTEELSSLKSQSIDIYRLWVAEGKPRHGATNSERLRVRAAYRRAMKDCQRKPKQKCWDRLHETLTTKSTDQFWKAWKSNYSVNKSHLHPVVNGLSSEPDIADSFQAHFINVSKPNNMDRVKKLDDDFKKDYAHAQSTHAESCMCHEHRISMDSLLDATFSMKKGKSADDNGITAEHYFYAPLALFDRLLCLFNVMLQHAVVPRQFQLGTIVPIIKDHQGNLGDLDNYRGITLASIMSKIFEHVLRIVFGKFITTSRYQFGFKKKSSTSHALFCLKETITYYTERGSNVYCSFLDASKAFDRVVHSGLFTKLLKRQVPFVFLDIIIYWYSALQCRVRWGNCHSAWFDIGAGVRQGGVLSPDLYCLYIDDLIVLLSGLHVGCYIRDVFMAALLYADDMALVSPSLKGLQTLLKVCEDYCVQWDICLNHKKSKNLAFGKLILNLGPVYLDGHRLEWVKSWKYLGITLESRETFNCCIDEKLKSFYRCLNSILRIEGRSSNLVMLKLLETHCLPILSYAIDVVYVVDRDKRRKLRVAYNAIFRKIYNYRSRDSVKELQATLSRPTWEELVKSRCEKFRLGLRSSSVPKVLH